jgi:7-keto-8-aminopelargonate synthetase-like enzyme
MTLDGAPTSFDSAVGAEIVLSGRRYISFGGSSYLGLASNPYILAAGIRALRQWGSGAPVPSNHNVTTRALVEVEKQARLFFASPTSIYLNAGYYFGLAAMAAVSAHYHAVFFDEFAHYSLLEAIAAGGLLRYSYRHLDLDDLACQIKQRLGPQQRPLIVTDGLFSTIGEIAPLDELLRIVSAYDGRLLVDESHSFGVLGPTGRGAVEHHSLESARLLRGGSLGKAFGTCGGIILAEESDAEPLRGSAVGRGASTGLTAAAAMCAASIRFVADHPELLVRLRENTRYLKEGLARLGLAIGGNDAAPIASFSTSSGTATRSLQRALMKEGIFVYHSTYVGAAEGGVIRCGIFADHTREHLDALLDALRRLL